MLELGCI